jgi:hypothetical protein
VHRAALNTATLVVVPGVDDVLPDAVLLHIIRRLKLPPERIGDMF